jgi:hypothetical protein
MVCAEPRATLAVELLARADPVNLLTEKGLMVNVVAQQRSLVFEARGRGHNVEGKAASSRGDRSVCSIGRRSRESKLSPI